MAAAPKQYAATGWYMEYQEGTSDKYYRVIVTETGVTMLQWGRRGSGYNGQNSVTAYATYDEARDQALKQVFAKKSKGYQQRYGDFTFMASTEAIDWARHGDVQRLAGEFEEALRTGSFTSAKDTVLKHYDSFAESVKQLLERADTGDFEATMDDFEQVSKVWEEINERHAEVTAAMGLARATLMQKLLSGSL